MSRILEKLGAVESLRQPMAKLSPLVTGKKVAASWASTTFFTFLFLLTFGVTLAIVDKQIARRHARLNPSPNPNSQEALRTGNEHALRLLGQNKVDEALKEFALLTGLDPANSQIQVNMALAYKKKGEKKKAREILVKTIEAGTTDSSAYNNLAVLDLEDGKSDDALKNLGMALKSPKVDPAVYLNAARAHEEQSLFDLAVQDYQGYLQATALLQIDSRQVVLERVRRLRTLASAKKNAPEQVTQLRAPASTSVEEGEGEEP